MLTGNDVLGLGVQDRGGGRRERGQEVCERVISGGAEPHAGGT